MSSPDVLHVITKGDVGGAQTHVVELAREQLRVGLHVEVAAGTGGAALDAVARAGAATRHLPDLDRAISPRGDLRALRAIEELVDQARPSVVHAHSSKAGLLARLAGRRARVPVVYTAHGWPFQRGAALTQRVASFGGEAFAAHAWGDVICLTEHEAELARRYLVTRRQHVHVVPNGLTDVETELIAQPDRGTTPLIVMSARFAPPKDHLGALAALARLKEQPWELVFAGDGPKRSAAIDAVSRFDLAERVRFAGQVDDVPALLASAHLALLWSEYEGLPISVLEAMRAGLPTVANDLAGTRLLLGAGEGVVVPKDTSALASALGVLLGEPARRADLGRTARKQFLASYQISVIEPRIRAVYDIVRGAGRDR